MIARIVSSRIVIAAIAAALALSGTACSRFGNQRAPIEQAIRDHLSAVSDLAMDQMVLQVSDVKIDGDSAGADVVFSTHSNPPARMSYHYELRKQDGGWKVTGGWPSGSQGAQHPTMGQTMGQDGQPAEGSASGNSSPSMLPEGHPPIPPVPNPHE